MNQTKMVGHYHHPTIFISKGFIAAAALIVHDFFSGLLISPIAIQKPNFPAAPR